MNKVRADLHIHTVLSPCGDLEMSPANILSFAKKQKLDIIGITDHNSTRQGQLMRPYFEKEGIFVLTGAEVTTMEEVHCLTFFPDDKTLQEFQAYIDEHLPPISNKPDKFGYQVIADMEDNIIGQEDKLLISALDQDIEDIEKKVRQLNGIFIPAHIDKARFSILSQLGFIPPSLNFDALEISPHTTLDDFISKHPELKKFPFIQSSDAHYPGDIGKVFITLEVEEMSFDAIKKAIRNKT